MGWDPSHDRFDDDVTGLAGDPFDTFGAPQGRTSRAPGRVRPAARGDVVAGIIALVFVVSLIVAAISHR